MKKTYKFINRLINKITLNGQPNNDSFFYYGHWVELQSGTVDYVSVIIYNTSDRYSGTLMEFQFDFGQGNFALMSYHAMKSMMLL